MQITEARQYLNMVNKLSTRLKELKPLISYILNSKGIVYIEPDFNTIGVYAYTKEDDLKERFEQELKKLFNPVWKQDGGFWLITGPIGVIVRINLY